MSNKEKNQNRRYIGKVKNQKGRFGDFQKILLDNPNPQNQDGSANPYYKGTLVWLDQETGKKYVVKQLSVRGVPNAAKERGFVSSISIDLDDSYEVIPS